MMSLSRIWLFLLTLVGGLLLLCLLLAPGQVRRSLGGSARSRVELGQQSATLLLANSARLWIDTAAQLAGDAALGASLEEQLRGQAEPELLHRTVQQQLKKAGEALKLSFVIVTDAGGRVIARAGRDEAAWRDAIDGYPLVVDAVRGYRLDDLWIEGGVLYRVAAAPIIASGRDRYVGAVILGQAVGDELAEQLRAAVGLDVVFLGDGKVLASSRPRDRVPQELVQFAASNMAALQGGGHSPALDVGDELAVLVGLPGEAAARGAAIGLLSAGPAGASMRSVLANLAGAAAEGDLPLWQLPAAGGGVLLAFFIGLLLLRAEGEGKVQRLAAEVRRLAEQPGERLDEERHKGPLRDLAVAVNAALVAAPPVVVPGPALLAPDHEIGQDRAPRRPSVPPVTTPSLGAVGPAQTLPTGGARSPSGRVDPKLPLGPQAADASAPVPGSPFAPPSVPYAPPLTSAPPVAAPPRPTSGLAAAVGDADSADTLPRTTPAPMPAPRRAPSASSPIRGASGIPVPPARTLPTEPLRSGRGPVDLGEPEGETASSRTLLDPVLDADLEPSQLSPPPELPTVQDIPQSVVQAAIEQALGTPAAPFAGTPRSASAGPYGGGRGGARPSATPTGEVRLGASRPAPDLTEEITAVNRTPPVLEEDDLEASFRRTYQEFIVTKQRCNEPVEGLTYDKFVVKLKQSRDQIMRQHNCRAVRFHVYVKEGKAALKATPVTR